MTQVRRVVLASASPRRLELLRSLGFEVDVQPSGYAEPDDPAATPAQLAIRHAREKIRDVAPHHRGAVVIAADTVVDVDGATLGKPRDAGDARRMLRLLSGRAHQVHTAYALIVPGDTRVHEEAATTDVRFYSLSQTEIDEYVATGEPMDKAGAYGIQGRAAALVERIDGDFYTVMGFPLARFVRALRRLGFTPPTANNRANR